MFHKIRAVLPVDKDHKNKTCRHAGHDTGRASHGTKDRNTALVISGKNLNEQHRGTDADNGIQHLLDDLGDGCRHHRRMCLEISPQDTEETGQKDGRRQHPEDRDRLLLTVRNQDGCTKEGKQTGDRSYDQNIDQGAAEHLMSFPVLF